MRPLVMTVCFLGTLVPQWAQRTPAVIPFDSAQGATEGKSLFQLHCSYCHGANGEGGRGADLTTGVYRNGGSDAELFATIHDGIPGTEMPAVRATDDEVWKWSRSSSALGPPACVRKPRATLPPAKPYSKARAEALACHAIGRDGGNLGPDLNDVGRRRNLKYLEESIVSPEADVRIAERHLKNVQKVIGTESDPHLPPGIADLILIANAYHEFTQPEEMMAAVRRCLKPNGWVAAVLYTITMPQLRSEIESMGFRLERVLDFLPMQHGLIFVKQ